MKRRIRVIEDSQDFLKLEPAWTAMVLIGRFTPFQSFAWNRAWWECVGQYNVGMKLYLIVVEENNEIMAIAPMVIKESENLRTLQVLGDPYSDYHDIITRDNSCRVALSEIVGHLSSQLGYLWDRVQFGEVPSHSPLNLLSLQNCIPAVKATPSSECPFLRLDDAAAMEAISGKREYVKKKRLLEGMGRLRCICHVTSEAISQRLPDYMEMHRNQWLPRPNCGITFQDPEIIRFYESSVDRLTKQGLLMLVELTLNMQPIAFYYGYTFNSAFWGYRPAFDVRLAKLSPGHVMHNLLFAELLSKGYETFDFMRGSFGYKFRYASGVNRNTSYTIEGI